MKTLKRFLTVVGSVLMGRYQTSLAVEVDMRITKLMAASPSADEALLRLDQAVLIAQCGGISTEKLEALLCYGVVEMLTPTSTRALEAAGISTTPWIQTVADVGGVDAINETRRVMFGPTLIEEQMADILTRITNDPVATQHLTSKISQVGLTSEDVLAAADDLHRAGVDARYIPGAVIGALDLAEEEA